MKKLSSTLLFITFLAFVLSSCTKSTEEKAKELSEAKIKESLIIPDSYDLASIEVDSAFTPYDDPQFYELTIELAKDGTAIEQAKRDMDDAQSSIALWASPYQTSYGLNEQNQAKAKYRQAKKAESDATEHAKSIAEKMRVMFSKDPEFIGMKAKVSYRAKSNNGNVQIGTAKVLFDKDMTKVINIYDMDVEEYQAFIAVCNEIEKNTQK